MPQTIAAASVEAMLAREKALFVQRNPTSAALAGKTAENWLRGVPMHWMVDWGTRMHLIAGAGLRGTR
jgi:glutamate-1-semialdehyde 2,1-aminomutase